ncbi:MAG: sigma-70 family RNA polymerase sigma factor, partial [Candidatus Aminicenantes bacterium]|nr:sigma-70 family RNA polymerase sigma factor [Candidatus Aminicenantes bacterium]
GEMILPETRNNPEETVIKDSQQQQIDRLLREIIEGLNGEEQLIIRMRFPANPDQDSESIETIARIMDLSPKAVYKRISRVLKKCREKFEKKGISSHDLL